MARPVFPFAAIVGQDDMKLAILIAAVDRGIGGVLVFGDRGTGKSTAVRALAALLPPIKVVEGCRYGCDPATPDAWCTDCAAVPVEAEERDGTRAGGGSATGRDRGSGCGRARPGTGADRYQGV